MSFCLAPELLTALYVTILERAGVSGQGDCVTTAYLNSIATAVPPHDVHEAFVAFAGSQLDGDNRRAAIFNRLVDRDGIDHRYSCLAPGSDPANGAVDADGIYARGQFPDTAKRMRLFEMHAPVLAARAVEKLNLGSQRDSITHLVVTCCTGFSAPGIDLEIVERCGLSPSVERTMVGFMGCYAAMNALKLGRHIVRSEPDARVLVVNLELCTLHMKETADLEQILSFLIFADGCSASLISSEPEGFALDSFHAVLAPDTASLITWNIGDSGFDMVLSGRVPGAIQETLSTRGPEILRGAAVCDIDLWAVHPGGRTVLDAVERALQLGPQALAASREVLRRFGNMSSATVMFVLESMLLSAPKEKAGCAMAFGPGLVAETMLFRSGR
ncbi:MAG: Naringenin-chalcone synthase [Hyphomicrobiales bacterium]|nr:Naringenin-chalcone synthase [Hyphomicrobiales bacterium]